MPVCAHPQDVEVAPGDPNIFWSAGEDGMVRQFDRRLGNQKVFESPNVLISVAHHNKVVELKALDINKVRASDHLLGSMLSGLSCSSCHWCIVHAALFVCAPQPL